VAIEASILQAHPSQFEWAVVAGAVLPVDGNGLPHRHRMLRARLVWPRPTYWERRPRSEIRLWIAVVGVPSSNRCSCWQGWAESCCRPSQEAALGGRGDPPEFRRRVLGLLAAGRRGGDRLGRVCVGWPPSPLPSAYFRPVATALPVQLRHAEQRVQLALCRVASPFATNT
jgi:hypothetical protein